MNRHIPKRASIVWAVEGALFAAALMIGQPTVAWCVAALALAWFAAWEAHGVVTTEAGDTLSESIWKLLDVRDNKPVNRAFFPLVMGVFLGAVCLFVGLVAGTMPWPFELHGGFRIAAAVAVGAGTYGFLWRHFRRGDSR